MTTLDSIVEEIKKAESIVVLTHETPDGDAIGSSLAMYNALKQIGKNVDVIIPECPRNFNFLTGYSEIKKEGKITNYDLAITCLLYTSPSPRDTERSRMPSSA